MKIYIKYLKYVLEHKKNVFKICWSKGFYLHAITHDLSKFLPSEFIPYANWFYGEHGINKVTYPFRHEWAEKGFDKAWTHHYRKNKHHPEHYEYDWNKAYIDHVSLESCKLKAPKDMPTEQIKYMVCDLEAMSLKFGGTAQEYYMNNYHKWNMTREARYRLEIQLDLIYRYNAPICECNEEYWMTIEELALSMESFFDRNGKINMGTVENNINDLLKPACDNYNLNIHQLYKKSTIK